MNAAAPSGAQDERLTADFKEAFKRLAATVTVITYRTHDGESAGMTATSMCSLSLAPLSLLVCVNRSTKTHREIEAGRWFGVNLLSSGQERVADYCSRPGEHKTLPSSWLAQSVEARSPVLTDVVAHLDCELARVYQESTHSIFVGNVFGIRLGEREEPLLYCNRCYHRVSTKPDSDLLEAVWERVATGALS